MNTVIILVAPICFSFLSLFFFFLGWQWRWVGGLCWWWCESSWSRPDQRTHSCSLRYYHLLIFPPFFPLILSPSRPQNQQNKMKLATVFSSQWPTYTLPGVTAPTSAHARSHTHTPRASQSLSRRRAFFFFSFFCLFFFHSSGILFFYCWGKGVAFVIVCVFMNREGRDSKGTGNGCLVRGIPRCCSPSAPGKEREKKRVSFFWLA